VWQVDQAALNTGRSSLVTSVGARSALTSSAALVPTRVILSVLVVDEVNQQF
jgi:hypothetical protein